MPKRSSSGRPRSYEEAVPAGLVMSTFETHLPNLPPSRVRRAYLAAHVFELLLAIMGLLGALNYLANPHALAESPIGRTLHPFDELWTLAYALSGIGIIFGLARPSPRVEALALYVFSAAVLGNAVAVVALRGAVGFASAAIYLAVVIAFAIRVRAITLAVEAQNAIARRTPEGPRRELHRRTNGGT